MRKINRRPKNTRSVATQVVPPTDSTPKNYWHWGPGTKVIVKSGDFKGFEGTVSRYVPHNTSFHIIFADKGHAVISVEDLAEIETKQAQKAEDKLPEVKAELLNAPLLEEEEEIPLAEEAQAPVAIVVNEETETKENSQETLERLSLKENGFTLSELTKERESTVKGPFKRTIKAALKKGKIVKCGWKRGGEDVFISASLKSSSTEEPVQITQRTNPEIQPVSGADKIRPSDVAAAFGDFLTKLGEFLKTL